MQIPSDLGLDMIAEHVSNLLCLVLNEALFASKDPNQPQACWSLDVSWQGRTVDLFNLSTLLRITVVYSPYINSVGYPELEAFIQSLCVSS